MPGHGGLFGIAGVGWRILCSTRRAISSATEVAHASGLRIAINAQARTLALPELPRQWPLHVRQRVCKNCDDGGIFRQCFRHDLVECISGSVMIIEIETAVLDRTESRHPGFLHRRNVCATMFDQGKDARS